MVFGQKESSIKLSLIVENSKVNYLKVSLTVHACYSGDSLKD